MCLLLRVVVWVLLLCSRLLRFSVKCGTSALPLPPEALPSELITVVTPVFGSDVLPARELMAVAGFVVSALGISNWLKCVDVADFRERLLFRLPVRPSL